MILVGFFCVLGAIGLLIAGLAQADPDLVWASIAASAAGGLAVVAAAVQRGRALQRAERATGGPRAATVSTAVTSPGSEAKPPGGSPAAFGTSVAEQAPDRDAEAELAEAGDRADDLDDEVDQLPKDDAEYGDAVVDDVVIVDEPAGPADESADVDEPDVDEDDEDRADTGPIDPVVTGPVDTADTGPIDPEDEPAEEDVDMADLLTVVDLTEEVLVVDLRPRYHLARCEHLEGREVVPIPVNEAREDGFTPCSLCRPDAALAAAARSTRHPEPDPG